MNWRSIQKTNITKLSDLVGYLQLDPLNESRLLKAPSFPLNLPLRLAAKMEKNNLDDPLFRQFVALNLEDEKASHFTPDPTGEKEAQLTPRLLQKYPSRALLIPTSACAVHCRYCFRRHYPYESAPSDLAEELALISQDRSLTEIIVSGGDPLSISDDKLSKLLKQLDAIEHIRLIRIHTRLPIAIPERISTELTETISSLSTPVICILHINHPLELDSDVKWALHQLEGVQLLCQSVLLKGVNDNLETLKELSYKLIDAGILPYYIHQLDRVDGAAHFEVNKESGLELIEQMRKSMPGYLVPRYMQEIPGKLSKTPIL